MVIRIRSSNIQVKWTVIHSPAECFFLPLSKLINLVSWESEQVMITCSLSLNHWRAWATMLPAQIANGKILPHWAVEWNYASKPQGVLLHLSNGSLGFSDDGVRLWLLGSVWNGCHLPVVLHRGLVTGREGTCHHLQPAIGWQGRTRRRKKEEEDENGGCMGTAYSLLHRPAALAYHQRYGGNWFSLCH